MSNPHGWTALSNMVDFRCIYCGVTASSPLSGECSVKSLDQSTQKNENNYYETKIGDAIDEPPPVNPIPDRKDELPEQTDIEEFLDKEYYDDQEADLQRRERNEED